MKANDISGFFSAKFCISVFLIAGLFGTGAAESYDSIYSSDAPQTAQERAELFDAIQNMDEKSISQTAQNGTDLYKALQNPYTFKDPQAALEMANTYKELQKLNGIYSNSRSEDNWYYWTNMWLNGPQEAMGTNPYAFKDPQAALEMANTYKELQKLNGIYSNSRSEDNWYYWTEMWLNGPTT